MCAGLPIPADPVAMAQLAGRIAELAGGKPSKAPDYSCKRCGATLFGNIDERCPTCDGRQKG